MISKFVTVYPGHIDLPDMGQDATPANERRYSNERARRRVREDRGGGPEDGRAGLRHAVAGRAPLPARRLRVHSQHPHAGGAPGAPDEEPAHRLRLQRRADVAPAAPGRGLRRRRHPDQGPHCASASAAATTRARSRPSARRCWTPTPIASCSRSRSRSCSRRSTSESLLAPGQALHAAAGGAVPRLRAARSSRWCRGR